MARKISLRVALSDQVIAASHVRDHSAPPIDDYSAEPGSAGSGLPAPTGRGPSLGSRPIEEPAISSVVQEPTRPQIEALDQRMTEMDQAMREGRQRLEL